MNHNISTIEELSRLIASPKTADEQISLNLPFLDPAANRRYSEKLETYRHECGCGAGGRFLGLSAVTCAVLGVFRISVFATDRWKQLAIAAVIVFVSAMIGKAVGLIHAKLKLYMTLRAIRDALPRPG